MWMSSEDSLFQTRAYFVILEPCMWHLGDTKFKYPIYIYICLLALLYLIKGTDKVRFGLG